MRLTLIVWISWLLFCGFGFAAPSASDFGGWWAVRAGDRNFIVLHLEDGIEGRLQGEYWRPKDFSLNQEVVEEIKGPTIREAITDARLEHGGLTFTVTKPDKPDDQDRMLLKLASSERGELMFDTFQTLTMDATRVPSGSTVAEDWMSDRSYPLTRQAMIDAQPNAEMTRLFIADQGARKAAQIDWSVVIKEDAERRAATARLLDAGSLHTGDDFLHAAFIFQHGDKADDYLLAHTLATIAVKKGRRDAIWIASATLDRYLLKIGRSQIYGTQFQSGKAGTTQEPYFRSLISDALRAELDVPSQAAQEAQRIYLERSEMRH